MFFKYYFCQKLLKFATSKPTRNLSHERETKRLGGCREMVMTEYPLSRQNGGSWWPQCRRVNFEVVSSTSFRDSQIINAWDASARLLKATSGCSFNVQQAAYVSGICSRARIGITRVLESTRIRLFKAVSHFMKSPRAISTTHNALSTRKKMFSKPEVADDVTAGQEVKTYGAHILV